MSERDDDPRTRIQPRSPPENARDQEPRRPTAIAMIGALLNHIYRVDRFIAAGGMGAVYEGINVNTDERVAIKIILPHLAADPKIQTLFRNEARTLTRLSHPGLAQYRLLAYEPVLDVFYIVTEFIDGPPLSEALSQLAIGEAQLRSFAIRLASGLAAAHEWGTIHRDVSPDNILLPLGKLDKAKIIDFGIAKDLAAMNQTVIGDSFAGKFSFVAPEQFDDPDSVGPWSDVYSLGLVVLAVARGAPPSPSGSIAEAMKARQSIPDLSSVPAGMRGIVAKMLEPERAKRYQSMRDVVAALETPASAEVTHLDWSAPRRRAPRLPRVLWISAGAAVALAAGLVAAMYFRSAPSTVPTRPPSHPARVAAGVRTDEDLRRALEASLAAVPCTWLDMGRPAVIHDGVAVALSGVSGASDTAASVAAAAKAKGVAARIDTSKVFAVGAGACALLDAFRQFREPAATLIPGEAEFHFRKDEVRCPGHGKRQATVVMDVRVENPADDLSIVGMDAMGGVQQIILSRAIFEGLPSVTREPGAGSYRWAFCVDQDPGLRQDVLNGLLLVKGRGPFNLGLDPRATDTQTVPADWPAEFAARARARHWTTQMAWFRVVSDD